MDKNRPIAILSNPNEEEVDIQQIIQSINDKLQSKNYNK